MRKTFAKRNRGLLGFGATFESQECLDPQGLAFFRELPRGEASLMFGDRRQGRGEIVSSHSVVGRSQ
jgi:hypothetical protein